MLYVITNRNIIQHRNLFLVILESLRGGADGIILREKDLPTSELLDIGFKLRNITNTFGAKLIVNGNPYVSKAVNADYYHSGFESFDSASMLYGSPFGLSTHNLNEAEIAYKHGASYILLSHIYQTQCKQNLIPKGVELIKEVSTQIDIPIIALGGINETNINDCIDKGANGIAVMSYVMSSSDPYEATMKLKNAFKKSL